MIKIDFINDSHFRTGYPVTFIGSVPVGPKGDFSLVESAVENILKSEEKPPQQPVLLECQEMNVRVVSQSSGKVIIVILNSVCHASESHI